MHLTVVSVTASVTSTIELEVEPSATVLSVKEMISTKLSGSVLLEQQHLFSEGKELKDARTLSDYNVRGEQGRLSLTIASLRVTVIRGRGVSCVVEVEPSDSIDNVKAKLEDKMHLRAGEMRLVMDNQQQQQQQLLDGGDGGALMGALLQRASIKGAVTLYCKTLSPLWTESNFLLSQVASYLPVKDVVTLMVLLGKARQLSSEVMLVPSERLVASMIQRAVKSPRIVISPASVRWTSGGRQNSQIVTLPELRMLHHLVKAIPQEIVPAQPERAQSAEEHFVKYITPGVKAEKPSPPPLPAAQLAKVCADRWLALPEEEKKPWQEVERLDLERFQRETLAADTCKLDTGAAGAAVQCTAMCSLNQWSLQRPGSLTTCKLSAQIGGVGQGQGQGQPGVEICTPCKRCATAACPTVVLRTCPACKEVSCSCVRAGHAKRCAACRQDVCPGCIVAADQQQQQQQPPQQQLCTSCGFQCFACFSARRTATEKYICHAGAACVVTNDLCRECVFAHQALPTRTCDGCGKAWCRTCVEFPSCSACDATSLCDDCSEMVQCERCNANVHTEDCMWDAGHRCDYCETYLCNRCEVMAHCSNDDCGTTICSNCAKGQEAVVCSHGHVTCKSCVSESVVVDRCRAEEERWGGGSVWGKGCWACWTEAHAHARGFDSASAYDSAVRGAQTFNSPLLTTTDSSPPPLLLTTKRVQYWWLGGRKHPDTVAFDTCGLSAQLGAMSAQDKLDPRLALELISPSLSLSKVTVWASLQAVNGLSVNLRLGSAAAVGKHGPTPNSVCSSTLSLTAGERIVSVHMRYGNIVDSLRVVTSRGQNRTFGGPGGDEHVNYRVPAGWRLVGFFGGVGGHLHNLGVVIVKDLA